MTRTGILMALGLTLAAVPLAAQQGPRGRGFRGNGAGDGAPRLERNIELALGRAEELGLDENQIAELRALRDELSGVRGELAEEGRGVRQRMVDRTREARDATRQEMTALRERHQEALQPFPGRWDALLNEAQRNQVGTWMRQEARRGPGRRVPAARGNRPGAGMRGGGSGWPSRARLRSGRGMAPGAVGQAPARLRSGQRLLPAERAVLRNRMRVRRPGGGPA